MHFPHLHFPKPILFIFLLAALISAMTSVFFSAASPNMLKPGESAPPAQEKIDVVFHDVAKDAGLIHAHVWGGKESQDYLIEIKGSGLGFYDFDNDGWLDVYMPNGVRFGESYTPQTAPIPRLYKNNRDGTFTDVTARAGVGKTGWGTGVCIGDFDRSEERRVGKECS
jgi:hypothetical protein